MYNIFKVYLSPTNTTVGNAEFFSHKEGEKKFVLINNNGAGILIMAPSTTEHIEMPQLSSFGDGEIVAAGKFCTHYDAGFNDWQPAPRVTAWGSTSLKLKGHKISNDQKQEIERFIESYFSK